MDVFPSRTLGPLSVRLLCYEPGAQLARHHHAGATLSLMLEGGQRESVGERHYGAHFRAALVRNQGLPQYQDLIPPGTIRTTTAWPPRLPM